MVSVIGVIPARGGSQRIPRKNIREFRGLPLVGRTIQSMIQSGIFDAVFVSTDDAQVKRVAESFGASVPFLRPAHLATDTAPTGPVVRHAVEVLQALGHKFDEVCCTYPTAVFSTDKDWSAGLSLLRSRGARHSLVMSATTFDFPIWRARRRMADGWGRYIWPQYALERSQDLEEAVHDAGQFYWATAETWLSGTALDKGDVLLLMMERWRVVDIDTEEDWVQAEMLHEILQRRGTIP